MKKLLNLTLIASISLASCSKKNTSTPTPTNVLEYDFSANKSGEFVVNYYDGVSLGTAQDVNTQAWTGIITIPTGIDSAKVFFTAGQEPPYTNDNSGVVTIKLNGKIVATGSGQFTSSIALAEVNFTYKAN